MKQSKVMSLVESVTNIAVGFFISLPAQIYFLPLLGVAISLHQNLVFACIMTVISIARSFLMRRLFEALHIRDPLSPAALAIVAERRRQRDVEGWTLEHDRIAHSRGDLAHAGAAYALYAGEQLVTPPSEWSWDNEWWKPQGFRRDLIKAAALILAELDRFDSIKTRALP